MDFSIILPTYNRLSQLKRALQSIFKQDFGDYEVVVVNDGSNDGTDLYLKSLTLPKLKWIFQDNKGPAAARNAGIKIAKGKYIVFTDDDCVVPLDWLSSFSKIFKNTGADITGGAVKNCLANNFYSELSQEVTNFFVGHLNRTEKQTTFLTSNNIAYKADVLKTVGGFDERFRSPGGEERGLNHKIISQGGKAVFADNITVDHYHEMNVKRYLRQQFNYGKGAFILYNYLRLEFSREIKPIPALAYLLLIKSFFKINFFIAYRKLIMFCIAQTMVVCGYFTEWIKSRR